jgi:hypothetical protein
MSFMDNVVAYTEQPIQSKFGPYLRLVDLVNLGQPSFQGSEPSGRSRHGENVDGEPVHKKAVDPLDLRRRSEIPLERELHPIAQFLI